MSLTTLLLTEYADDEISKSIGNDPIRDVYYLTKHGNYSESVLFYRFNTAMEFIEDEDRDFYNDFVKKYPFIKDYEEYDHRQYFEDYEEGKIKKEDHKELIEFIDEHENRLHSMVDPDFTSSALSFTKILDNPTLFHFSEYAYDIMLEGFKKGMPNEDMLSLTTQWRDGIKDFGGFNFAFHQDGKIYNPTKYGPEVVVFTVPKAIQCTHYGDQEEQVIFWGSMAKDIIYLEPLPGDDGLDSFIYDIDMKLRSDKVDDAIELINGLLDMIRVISESDNIHSEIMNYIESNLEIELEQELSHEWEGDVKEKAKVLDTIIEYLDDYIGYHYTVVVGRMMVNGKEKKLILDIGEYGDGVESMIEGYAEHMDYEEVVKKFKSETEKSNES